MMAPSSEHRRPVWDVRHLLAGRGYQEVVNFAFVEEAWERDFCANEDPIRLANPIASQLSVMRSSLIAGLVGNLSTNRKRQIDRVRVFEVARVFQRKADGEPVAGFHQSMRVAGLAAGAALPEQWGERGRAVDFFDVKADVEALFAPRQLSFETLSHPALHPGRAANVLLDGHSVGVVGELHPVWVQRYDLGSAPVVFELELDAALQARMPAYREISRMPAVFRDLALVVGVDVTVARVIDALREVAPEVVKDIALFDVYHGKGIDPDKKSLAFRVLMQDTQRTLEDAEVDAAVAVLVQQAETALVHVCVVRGIDVTTLTKAELADLLFEQVGLNKREAKDMVEGFFEEIRTALERGDSVKLSGFGNFQLRDKPQRPGRNPKTGERDSDHCTACGDFPCQPETQGRGGATQRCKQATLISARDPAADSGKALFHDR